MLPCGFQERLGQALYRTEVNYQQVSDQLQGMQAKIDVAAGTSSPLHLLRNAAARYADGVVFACTNTEAADIAGVDVERYKRLAVQQEKSITALQARNQEAEARARDGAVNADIVAQLRNERDQISTLVRSHDRDTSARLPPAICDDLPNLSTAAMI